jgi:hypothetical protein
MDSVYREIRPSPTLAPCIECFWTGEVLNQFTARVLPDGCADILFIARKNELIDMQVVGVMTRPQEVDGHLIELCTCVAPPPTAP